MSSGAATPRRGVLAEYGCRFRYRFPVVPRLRSSEVNSVAVAHDRLPVPEHSTPRRHGRHFVPEFFELAARFFGPQFPAIDVTAAERAFREPPRLERLLHVEPEVGDVGDELRVRLRLVEPAHDPETDLHVASRHEGGDERGERTLAAGE